MRTLVGVVCLLIALVAPPALVAHEGHDHKMMGTVTHVAADHVVVRTKSGKEVTVKVTDKTKVKRATAVLTMAAVQVGTRVVLNLGAGAEPLTAREIEVGKAAPAAKAGA